jgi:hypothetical protein
VMRRNSHPRRHEPLAGPGLGHLDFPFLHLRVHARGVAGKPFRTGR